MIEGMQDSSRYWVMLWLFAIALLVFVLVVVGGITRLTGSGLSMVEWRPLMGILPPLSEGEWMRVYGLYQASPEFIHVNVDMGLGEFKTIFFWEYIHRVLGRLVGVAFVVPLVIFAVRKKLPQGYGLRFVGLLMLGGLQGLIGWWMVKSGLVHDPSVSQYRLAIHLALALLILGLLVWTALDLKDAPAPPPKGSLAVTIGILAVTIVAGAFVAGTDGGLVYNEYPLMGEGFVPVEYGEQGLWDAFENPASAQFHHRLLALIAVIGIIFLWWRGVKSHLALRAYLMLGAVFGQFALGILTLLYAVPVSLGVLHQGGAATLLVLVVWVVHGVCLRESFKSSA